MSIQKSSKSSGFSFFHLALFCSCITMGIAISSVLNTQKHSTEIENLCVAPFMGSPQHANLKLRTGEFVMGEMQILEDARVHYDYNISFQLELPTGTFDDDIDYNRESGVKTVDYSVLSADGSVKSGLYMFDEYVTWPLCHKKVYVSKLTTHWLQKK